MAVSEKLFAVIKELKTASHLHSNILVLNGTTASFLLADKSKLDGLVNYTHPATHSADMIADGTINKAYTSTEKSKLAGIATGATAYVHPSTHSADMIADGSTNKAYTATEKSKLAGIESGATADMAPAELLTAIKTVDGSGSGLDADVLQGAAPNANAGVANTIVKRDANGYIMNNWFNSNRGDEATIAASYLFDSGDGYMRKKTLANSRLELGGAIAWVVFNSGGGILASKNVASVTYHGVGIFTINFATAMPDTNYGYVASPTKDNDTITSAIVAYRMLNDTKSLTGMSIRTMYRDGGYGYFNSPQTTVLFFR